MSDQTTTLNSNVPITQTILTFPWSQPDHDGLLRKKGHIVKNWKLRWFVIKNDKIWYFKSQQEIEVPLGEIDLTDSVLSTSSPNIKKDNCFELVCGSGKIYYIRASSKEIMDKWIEQINKGSNFNEVTGPFEFQHQVHVDFTGNGFVGLPKEWEEWLSQAQLNQDDIKEHHDEILNGMQRLDEYYKHIEPAGSNIIDPMPLTETDLSLDEVVNNSGTKDIYKNFKLLGEGAAGEVYLATNSKNGQKVAIKK